MQRRIEISPRSHVEQQRSRRYSTHAPCSTRVPANGISVALEQACSVVSSKQCRFHDILALDRWFQCLGRSATRRFGIPVSPYARKRLYQLRGKLNYSKDGGGGYGARGIGVSRERCFAIVERSGLLYIRNFSGILIAI